MAHDTCSLCNTRPQKPKLALYGVPVCKKCYYGFANRRQIAYLIDVVLWQVAIIFPIGFVAGILSVNQTPSAAQQADIFLTIMPYPLFLIFAMKDGFKGKSLGKTICGVTTLDKDSFGPIGFVQSLKRNLILIVPIVPLVIAFMLQKGFRPGDGWANTKVVWTKYKNHPLFTGQLACENCQYDLRGCVSGACPECGCPIPERTQQAILDAGPPDLNAPTTTPN